MKYKTRFKLYNKTIIYHNLIKRNVFDNLDRPINEIIDSIKELEPIIKKYIEYVNMPRNRFIAGLRKEYPIEPDLRSGEETYGYNNIKDHLNYISDRFDAEFRLRWLLGLKDINYN